MAARSSAPTTVSLPPGRACQWYQRGGSCDMRLIAEPFDRRRDDLLLFESSEVANHQESDIGRFDQHEDRCKTIGGAWANTLAAEPTAAQDVPSPCDRDGDGHGE